MRVYAAQVMLTVEVIRQEVINTIANRERSRSASIGSEVVICRLLPPQASTLSRVCVLSQMNTLETGSSLKARVLLFKALWHVDVAKINTEHILKSRREIFL